MRSEDDGKVREAAELGLGALAAVVANSRDGIVVVTADRRYLYANPAACRIMGYTLHELRELPDFLANFPEREHEGMLEHFAEQLAGRSGLWTSTLLRPDGAEREITWSNMTFEIDGRPHGAAIFRDATEARQAGRNAAALGQAAAQLAGRAPLWEVLEALSRHAVDLTDAVASAIAVTGEHGTWEAGGTSPEIPDAFRQITLTTGVRTEDMPDGDVVLSGRTAVVPDARSRWLTGARPDVGRTLEELEWQAGVQVPLSWGDQVIGVLGVFLPPDVSGPTEADLAFYTALADQAAVAVVNDRMLAETGQASALRERARLARELHDSVSQALFSMTLHARAAQLAMAKDGLPAEGALGGSVTQLRALSQAALSEMRALIFELRPEALAEEGLVTALGKQAAALSVRSGVSIKVVAGVPRLELEPDTEEHLYRLVLEALNNTVKHAEASTASVDIEATGDRLSLTVTDDGVGFDPAEARTGHMGITTMRERAEAVGAQMAVESRPGHGTRIVVSLRDT